MANILIIDDETNIRLMMRLALKHAGHDVEMAADGLDGMTSYADGRKFELVILDQRMPGMYGIDVLRKIRDLKPDAKVIMVTAFGTIDLAVEAMKYGATDFLRKPFSAETLRGAVAAALDPATTKSVPVEEDLKPSFAMTTINGFRIHGRPEAAEHKEGDISFHFTLSDPEGTSRTCEVTLPAFVIELAKAATDREELPGGIRFWHALAEEVVANYVWQQGEFPPDSGIRVDDLTSGLKRWIHAVLEANEPAQY